MNDRDKIILIRDKEREYLRAACAVYDREALDNEWIALFQFRAIDGHRVFAANPERADRHELVIMRRAAELLPIQRAIERERFGVATS